MKKRVVVTGLGVISPAGCNKNEFWRTILSGVSCVSKLDFGKEYEKIPSKVVAVVPENILQDMIRENDITDSKFRTMSRSTCMALFAAKEAIADAKLDKIDTNLKENIGVAVGSGMANFADICQSEKNLLNSYNRVSPFFIPRILLNMAAGQISMKYEFQGPNHCVSTACATGAHAVGDSYKMIQNGAAIAMICGGTEACVNPLTVAGFSRLRALSTNFNENPEKASRPFDDKRDGFVIGEGSAIVVLEEMNHALTRGVNIYAEILGYGMSGDASGLTLPHKFGKGAILAMKRAISDAKCITTDNISYINAHATSTPAGDTIELSAINDLFKNASLNRDLYVSSTKGCHGHLLGAAGCLEIVGTVLACYHSLIPPTANLEKCSFISNLNCISEKQEWKNISRRIAIKNSFGFGGTNASLCISEFQQ